MSKQKILLVFGGESAEHEVSIRSARNVFDALDKAKYHVDLCYIDRSGRWWRVDDIQGEITTANQLNPVMGDGAFVDGRGEWVNPDVMLAVLHGPNGEDGSVQGLAQLLHIPIVGCGIIGSAICMDKDVAKRLLLQAGVAVVDCIVYRRGDPDLSYDTVAAKLGQVLFVKPANMGSSVGVSKVHNAGEFDQAMRLALQHDRKVLIERAVKGRELECAVLGNDHPQASVVGEILPGEEFYSYDAKYADDSKTQTTTQADLPADVAERIRQVAVQAYTALECRGLARVDFFLSTDGTVYVNEINTLPGFTSISMYPQLWQKSGVGYSELLDRLVTLASQ